MTKGGITRECEDIFGVMAMCPILIVMMISQMYNLLRLIQVYTLSMYSILCVK